MCHTYLQHYISCGHSNVAFVSCDDRHWYCDGDADSRSLEWRDHAHRVGVAHSYLRRCPQCVRREWDVGAARREREGISAWQAFAGEEGGVVDDGDGSDEREDGELGRFGLDARRVARRSAGLSSQAGGGDRDVIPALWFDGTMSEGSRTEPPPPPSTESSSDSFADPLSALDSVNEYILALTQLCKTHATESLTWFPGLEQWSFEAVEEVLSEYIGRELEEIIFFNTEIQIMSGPSDFEGDINFDSFMDKRSIAVASILYTILDNGAGSQVWRVITGKLRSLLNSTHGGTGTVTRSRVTLDELRSDVFEMPSQRLWYARRTFEWLVVLIYQHKLAYDQLSLASENQPAPGLVLQQAWEKYINVTRSGSRDVVWNVVVDAIDPIAEQGTRALELWGNDTPSRSRADDAAGDEMYSPVRSEHNIPERALAFSATMNESNRNSRTPETVATSVQATHGQQQNVGNSSGAGPSQTSNTHIFRECHDPTHSGRKPSWNTARGLKRSIREHCDDPRPHRREQIPEEDNTHNVLFEFSGCGHHNVVAVQKLKVSDQGKVLANCGCSGFQEQVLTSQRVFSLGQCLVCR